MLTRWRMKGDYLKTCNCAPGCPCDFWAPPTHGACEGFNAMYVREGHFDAVSLNGIFWALSYRWPVQPYVDVRATAAQRDAILTILSGKAGCTWFEVIASVVSKVLTPKFVPIEMKFDLKKRMGSCTVPGEIEVVTEPIRDMNGKELAAQIRLPQGMEYFEAEVAASKVLKSTGPIPFDHCNTHSTFSEVEYTPSGLQ